MTRRTRTPTTVQTIDNCGDRPRLPAPLRATGQVVMTRPPQTGAPAHKPLDRSYTEPHPTRPGAERFVLLLTAACQPPADGQPPQPHTYLSAGWADHTYQARPCPTCFPTGEATP